MVNRLFLVPYEKIKPFPLQLVSGDTSATTSHPRAEQNYKYFNSWYIIIVNINT